MARILWRKTLKEDVTKAFDLYMELNTKGKPVHTLAQISSMTGMSLARLRYYTLNKLHRWSSLRREVMERAADAASARTLARRAAEKKRRERSMSKAIENLADIIYEVREYNYMMYEALTAPSKGDLKKRRGKKRGLLNFKWKPESRAEIHRAWMDSLTKLVDIFGAPTIKQLAAEQVSHHVLSRKEEEVAQSPASSVNLNFYQGGQAQALPAPRGAGDLADANYELVMEIMAGEGKISGPVGYTGPKETSIIEGVDDAVIACPRGSDSEG